MTQDSRPSLPAICFACTSPVDRQAFDNIRAPVACPVCARRARLASGNALLTDVLQSTRPYPLEGSGLAAFLNPLLIDDKRVWADYVAGAVIPFQEVLPSRDHFDFVAQHVEPWCDALSTFSALRSIDPRPEMALEKWALAQSAAERQRFLDALERLGIFWQMSRRANVALQRHGPIHTNEEAWNVIESARGFASLLETETREMLRRLSALAERSVTRA